MAEPQGEFSGLLREQRTRARLTQRELADALAGLLLAIGVPAAQVPPGLEARAALWRDQVAELAALPA